MCSLEVSRIHITLRLNLKYLSYVCDFHTYEKAVPCAIECICCGSIYPWFKFDFPLFQTHYHTLQYPKNKRKQNLNQG